MGLDLKKYSAIKNTNFYSINLDIEELVTSDYIGDFDSIINDVINGIVTTEKRLYTVVYGEIFYSIGSSILILTVKNNIIRVMSVEEIANEVMIYLKNTMGEDYPSKNV